ncbi:hypothetical protein BDR22DRAFT_917471 [Usnea florida]
MSHIVGPDVGSAFHKGPSPTPFPSLTGLRSGMRIGKPKSVTIGSSVTCIDLHNATANLAASPMAVLQAAWAVILSTYTAAQDDVSFTTIIASPECQQSDHLRGSDFLTNLTRVCLDTTQECGHITIGSLLLHLTQSNALALHGSKLPALSVAHHDDLGRYGTIVAWKSNECSEANDGASTSSYCLLEIGNYAVGFVAWPDLTGALKLEIQYIDTYLKKTSALVMLKQLNDVFAFILANPAGTIASSVSAIGTSLLSKYNETLEESIECNLPPYLQAQFEYFAFHSPHRVALDFRKDLHDKTSRDNTTWTYEQLNDRADNFATYLIHRFGQLKDEVIPICMERRPELYIAILGILKTGGAWCPIDSSFPARRRHKLIARTGARMVIVAEQSSSDTIKGVPESVITINVTCLEGTTANRVEASGAKMGSLAYLIWTSGTTGDPKGVPIHHEAAVTSMRALQRAIPVNVSGGIVRCLQFSQFTFDVFVQDLFYTWGVGGTVISSTQEIMLGSFAELATKAGATHAHLTPTFAASVPRERCPTLKVVTMIGEKLSQAVADDWSQDMRAFNTYGPAETSVVSTFRQFGAAGDNIRSENIGFPLVSVSAFVMRDNRPIMRHGIGELALGGPQLSKGYWNDSERSFERFVWNEHCSRHLYMTGDLVRQLCDGSFEFIGRTDDLIKIQGIRVELSEISFSLRSCHPLVEQVEVLYLHRHDRPSSVIVAFLAAPDLSEIEEPASEFIASKDSIPVAQSALREAQKNLPGYMVPSVFLVLNRIPRTSSAKVDKAALMRIYSSIDLAKWEVTLTSGDDNVREVTTWTTRESALIAILAQLSGTCPKSISRSTNLRSIGIDSIAATRLAPLLNANRFCVSVADILQCHNLDDVAKIIDKPRNIRQKKNYDLEAFHNEWFDRVRNLIKKSDMFVAPALPLQESLLSESMQDASAYWNHSFHSFGAEVDIPRLHEAWLQVVNDTEALRTGFIPSAALLEQNNGQYLSNSTFLQLIYAKPEFDWACVKSSEADMKDIAVQKAHVVAKSHQKMYFRHPLLAITIFALPERRVMMLSVHHSVRDETSLDFILEDVSKSYQNVARRSNQRHQLRDALQVMLPTKVQKDGDEKYWSATLKDFVATGDATGWPDLTGKKMRSEVQGAAFISHTRAVNLSYGELQSAAFSFGASSVASILRVAWGLVLLEYLETDSVVFGETWSTRIDEFALADVVGPLLTVLPVPFRAQGSARQALIAHSHLQRESRDHRSVHSQVVRKLLGRSERQPLYPAVFNFLPDLSGDRRNGCSSMWNKVDSIVSLAVEHPLALNVAQTGTGVLEMEISASRKVMSSDHLAVLAVQVEAFVETMLNSPDRPLTQLSSLFPREMLSVTSVSFSENVRLAWKQNPTDWVDHYAAAHPDWLAAQVVTSLSGGESEYESWSFEELRSAYKRVAAFIIHGSCSNCMIAVCLNRRIEAYAIILGILASGNTYLPIDEDLPGERKSFLLQDSKAAMVFTIRSLALTFPPECRVIYVDDTAYMEQMVNDNAVDLPSQIKASRNAYLLYTSGSTGVPKGVLVGRGNLCSFIEGLSEFICPLIPGMKDLPGKGRYLGLASRAFDVHIAEMFLAWRQGLAAVTASRTMLLDNLELALRKLRITHASFVPSLVDQAGLNPVNLPDLHYLGVGGEKMSKRVVDTWASNDNATLINAYGPTEMSIGCTAAEVTPESNLRNVGRPYGNSVAHVLVPGSKKYTLRGVAGELCFTGDLVANGYHNRPDARGFVDDFNGERMYRTGDIVRLMADDTVEYLRREDDQTKVRGQRLELGEITEAIRSTAVRTLGLSKIDVATLIAQHPKLSRPQLVSFVVPIPHPNNASGCPETLGSTHDRSITCEIQKGCQKVLPAYMVPDVVIPLTKLPLAPSSGKADLKRLKVLFADMPVTDITRHVFSEGPIQRKASRRELTVAERDVLSAITSALNVDAAEIAVDTNIFGLGLDSLSAISLAIRLQQLGYDCTVSNVLGNPFLEQLALLPQKDHCRETPTENLKQTKSRIANLEAKFRAIHAQGLGDSSIQAVKPCLPLQETLVATSLNDKSSTLYVNHVVLRLSIEIDQTRLYNAWAQVVADHEILRTCFQEFEDGFVQIVLQFGESRSVHWSEIPTEDPELAFLLQQRKLATEIISDIAIKAPIRLTLFRPFSDKNPSILMITIHHALYDGESIAMVLEELNARYHSVIPSVHAPFDSMIHYVYSQDQERSKLFWTNYLANYGPKSSVIRVDDTCENPNDITFQTVDRTIASSLSELEDFSSSISGTPTSTVQAVFGVILAQVLKEHDVVFGTVLSGRILPIENPHSIVAPCITTVPQRVNIRSDKAIITDIVKEAQQGFIASLEFQHTALRYIHRWLGAEKPLFDCLISYIQKPDSRSRPYPQVWTELENSMSNEFPLSIEFEADHEADRVHAHCTFSPAFGDLDKITFLLESIDLLLGALIRREDVTTEDLKFSKSDAMEVKSKRSNWDESFWTPRELAIRELAAEISGIDAKEISKGASFFSLGIDSITAIRLAQGLRRAEFECSSADVMRYSCIAALAQKLDTPPLRNEVTRKVAGRPLEDDMKNVMANIPIFSSRDIVTGMYVTTPLQSSMLTQTLGSDGRLYSQHHVVELAAHVELPRLKQSWACLAARTEILRTTFHFSTAMSKWLAAVHQESLDAWTELDVDTPMSESLNDLANQFVFHEEADFEQPPWRTTVLKTAIKTVLAVSMHHSLYDGESINLLLQDLARLYEGMDLQPRVPFSDAARAILKSSTDAEDYWLRELEGFDRNENCPSPKTIGTDMIEIETTLKMYIGSTLQGCKDLGVTPQTVALLAFAKTLVCVSGRRDIVFGQVVGGRSLEMPGADDVAGPLFNTVPARVIFDKTYTTNKAAALKIQQSSGDSQPHQHASLGRIQQAWRQKVGDANAELFDTLFVFQNTANKVSPASRLWTPLNIGGAVAPTEYPANFEIEQRQDAIILRLASHKALRTREQLQTWLAEFSEAFQDILEQPQRSVLAFPAPLHGLPLTTTRNYKSHHSSPQDDIEPGSDLKCVRTALSAISGIALGEIPLNASIFSLGLDSMSAIQVAARCREDGYSVSVADVLQGRSLAGICRRLRRSAPAKPLHDTGAIISTESRSRAIVGARVNNEDDVEDVLPCLAGQVYHLARWLKSRRTMCEAVFTYQCSMRIQIDGMKYAWRRLRERHSILRTIFVAISPEEVLQVVLKPSALDDSSFECTELSDDSDNGVIDQIKRDARQTFDFFSPPVKLSVLRGATQDFVVFKLHHATYDALTIRTITADLASLYHGNPLPTLPRFDSFIAHTFHSLHTTPAQEYWLKSLNHHQCTLLQLTPTASIHPKPQTTTLAIPSAIPHLRSLTSLSHRTPITIPILLILAYARALSHLTHVAHPTFGLYQAARSAPFSRIDELCAPCVNITPVVVPNATEQGSIVAETLGRLQGDLAERVEFEQGFMGDVVRWVGCGGGDGEPGFNTFVNILWGEGKGSCASELSEPAESSTTGMRTPRTTTTPNPPDPLFTPWQPRPISIDTAPASQTTHSSTPIDDLNISYLAEKNFYLDMVRNIQNDCIDFSIRCDADLMDEGKARTFARNIAGEVDEIVEDLQRAGVGKKGPEYEGEGGGGGGG